ncbi:hypothetical protein SNEBB_002584 [Seison nebaliae]|nr:hypothetical protein SNEBB_002584 [Seison nebaliae]
MVINTLNDIKDSDEEEMNNARQHYYAGGSDRSGQEIVGPERPDTSMLFRILQQNALNQDIRSEDLTDSRVKRVLKIWSNGFSIDDGPLRLLDDDNNRQFLGRILKGEMPPELSGGNQDAINLAIENNMTEEYTAPAMKPFSGSGRVLGNIAPEFVGSPSYPTELIQEQQKAKEMAEKKNFELSIDENEPTCFVQIRTMDQNKYRVKVNPFKHRITDLRQYVCSENPDYNLKPFLFVVPFPTPKRELHEENSTIDEAKIRNTTIQQQMVKGFDP